jgi:hypothetical protein
MTSHAAWPSQLLARGSRIVATPSGRRVGRTLALVGAALLLVRIFGLG